MNQNYEDSLGIFGERLVKLKAAAKDMAESGLWSGALVDDVRDALKMYDAAKERLDRSIKGSAQ